MSENIFDRVGIDLSDLSDAELQEMKELILKKPVGTRCDGRPAEAGRCG